ncbi:hypothetical protein LPY66_06200 [Dehalobacter sp. DCM]|uniref:hypothetical protein n=1 Tax=Dehalobacter sp. DCM TaxID=2907827 RepID=UPI003081E5E7|nr:hypothetical protein LPY66_06200 [Dehalobacter sp. DCM]
MTKENYTVAELLAMLQEDDSWEKDPDKRAKLVQAYRMRLSVPSGLKSNLSNAMGQTSSGQHRDKLDNNENHN